MFNLFFFRFLVYRYPITTALLLSVIPLQHVSRCELENIAIEQSFVGKHICMAYSQVAQKTDILKEVSFWVISS